MTRIRQIVLLAVAQAVMFYIPGVMQTTTVVYLGDSIILNCTLEPGVTHPDWRGPPNYTLYYEGGTGRFNPHLGKKLPRLSLRADNISLIINNCTLNDTGEYRCTKTVDKKVYENETAIKVRIRPLKPEIKTTALVDSNGARATEDRNFTVTCTSSGGHPAPTVALYIENIAGEVLASTNTGTPIGDTYNVILNHTFAPKRQYDRKKLVCRSYYPVPDNAKDSQTSSVFLYLYLKPSLPVVTQSGNVVSGNNVTVNCRTTGSRPAANITWLYQGNTYTPKATETRDQATETFTVVSLLSRRVTANDNGQEVQCTVTNRAVAADLKASIPLNVEFPVMPHSTTITGKNNIIADGSNPLKLNCTTGSSNPASNITWRNGPKDISNNNTYTETTGANKGVVRSQTLTLYPTRYEDGDTISCLVSNGISSVTVTASFRLDLLYSPLISDISNMNVTELNSITLKCNAISNPPANFSWERDSGIITSGKGTASSNGLDLEFPVVHRHQAGQYTCNADNNIPPRDSKQTTLTVLYPPDIIVTAVNTSVKSHSVNVTCKAKGVPDQYTYTNWMHTWDDQVVVHPNPLPAEMVLTFTELSYAHSGVFTCGASNGIKEVSHGSGRLLVKSFPVITGHVAEKMEIKTSGQLMRPMKVTFQYYSNAENDSVTVYRNDSTRQEVGKIQLRDVEIKLQVFESEIETNGTEAIFNITVSEESQFGAYRIVVENEIGLVNLSLILQPLGPPEPPSDVNITVLDHHSVNVTWKSGYPNGLNQTFVIQMSKDSSNWKNYSHYGGLTFQQTHSIKITTLDSNQLYFVRMVAKNNRGESEPTNVLTFETAAPSESSTGPSSGVIVGGATGGIAAVLVIVAVVLFIIWRRKGVTSHGKVKEQDAFVDSSIENMGFEERDEVINTMYQSAGALQNETTLTASASKPTSRFLPGADIYAKVNKKPEVVYAMPDKQTDGKKKKRKKDKANIATGDVYENSPSDRYTNDATVPAGEGVYEDTSIGASKAPKKTQRADGLVYADLEFKSLPKGKGQNKIIGIEDKCEYTTIDLTKKAKPLPDGDDEEKK